MKFSTAKAKGFPMVGLRPLYVVMAFIILLAFMAVPLPAAETVEVIVEGMS
jgi:hypothetical protein